MPHFTADDVRAKQIEDLTTKVTLILSELPQRELLDARAELRRMAAGDHVPQAVLQQLALVDAALAARAAHLRHHTYFHLHHAETA